MSTVFKKTRQKVNIKQGEYFSIETGEELIETHGKTLAVIKETGKVEVHYDEYVVVNVRVLDFLKTILTKEEFSKVQQMSYMVKGDANFLHTQYGTRHTFDSLSEELDLSRNRFYKFLEKMYKEGIVWKTIGFDRDFIQAGETRRKVKYYILNPQIAKTGKGYNPDVIAYFAKFKMTL